MGTPSESPAFPPEPWRSATVPPDAGDGDLAFACPRCRRDVEEPAYGPCADCRAALRAALGGRAREIAREDYIPKMNVTPDAVALKD